MTSLAHFWRILVLIAFIVPASLMLFLLPNFSSVEVYGIEMFSEAEAPFGLSYDEWVSRFWNWWISVPEGEYIPPPGGCIVNRSDGQNGSMVMLMENADPPNEIASTTNVCQISTKDGILIPLWVGWYDIAPTDDYPNKKLSDMARQEANLGDIVSNVVVDGVPVAELDVSLSLVSGEVDYEVRKFRNVSEIYTSDFDLFIPDTTHKPKQIFGDRIAGSHGWWVFLKELPAGEHTIDYRVHVTWSPQERLIHDIKYHLDVV